MVLRPVDVEALVPEDHEVRAIWEFVGRLDLSRYYEDIEVIEGEYFLKFCKYLSDIS